MAFIHDDMVEVCSIHMSVSILHGVHITENRIHFAAFGLSILHTSEAPNLILTFNLMLIIENQWWVGITRTEAPVWASKVLVDEAVLDWLLAHFGIISLWIWVSVWFYSHYFVFIIYMARLSVVAQSSMARDKWIWLIFGYEPLSLVVSDGFFFVFFFWYLVLDEHDRILILLDCYERSSWGGLVCVVGS